MFEGVVEDIHDPLEIGRVRVRVFGLHTEDKSRIPTESLPWALVAQSTSSAAVSGVGESPTGLVQGTTVIGYFRDGKNYQQPVVTGTLPGIPEEKPNSQKGFSDPDGEYPLDDRIGESDVNRLARGDISDSVIETRNNSVSENVPTPNGGSWSEPESPYGAQYPHNTVKQSKSGHITEDDDTEGKERISRIHRTGTGYEVFPNGDEVCRVVGDNYEVVAGSNYIYVKGDAYVTVGGSTYLKSEGKVTAEAPEFDIGTEGPEPIILGEKFSTWVMAKLKVWLDTHQHYGNLGFPTTPPIMPFDPAEAAPDGDIYSKKNRSQ